MDPLKVTTPQETKLHFLAYWRIIRIRKTVIRAVVLLVVIPAPLVAFSQSESFSSVTRIKIERDVSDVPGLPDRPLTGGYDPYFIQTEFEVIQSEVILGKVIQDLDLNKDWGKKYAGGEMLKTTETMAVLKGRMDLRPVRNTELIEIRVFSERPEEAAKIANAIAKAYKDYRREYRHNMTSGGISSLLDKRDEQDTLVKKAEGEVERLRAELKIPDQIANGEGPTALMTADTLRKIEGMRLENQAEYDRQKTMLARLKSLAPDDLVQTIPTIAADSSLSSLLDQLNNAEQFLIVKRKDYGPEHAEVLKLEGQIADLRNKINKRRDGIMFALDAKVASQKEMLDHLELQVQKALEAAIQKASNSRPYFDAKKELEEKRNFLRILNMKIAAERIDVDLPKSAMVEIIDQAVPGTHPVRPSKPLNIALGIIIGLVVGVGLAFFIEYRDTSVKTIDDVERTLQSAVLGVIPPNVGLVMHEGAESPHAEAYRVLRTNLLFSRKADKLNTVAIVSAGAGEGKSTTVFNLAAVFAQSGQRVLIVDSDLRRPTLHKMLGVTNSLGLTDYLLKQNRLEEVVQTSILPTLDLMPSGKLPSSSLGILSSAQMKDLISELKQRYDFVFFDSPPIMGVSHASILASEVDMTLQVIQYRRYPQPMNIRAKQLIEKLGGNLIGIVLNHIHTPQDESYYYYSGYYHEYYSRNDDGEAATKSQNGSNDKARLYYKQKC